METELIEPSRPIVQLIPKDDKLEFIRCSSCRMIPFPTQIFLCAKGHIFCSLCAAQKKLCPEKRDKHHKNRRLCRRVIKAVNAPMHLYESIYKEGAFSCPYFQNGCNQTFLGNSVIGHTKYCDYRPNHPCPVPNCGARTDSAANLCLHLRRSHEIPFSRTTMKTFHISYNQYNYVAKGAIGKQFPQLFQILSTFFLVIVEEVESNVKFGLWHFSDDVNNIRCIPYRLLIHGKTISNFHSEWTGKSRELPNHNKTQLIDIPDESFTIKGNVLEERHLNRHNKSFYWTVGLFMPKNMDSTQLMKWNLPSIRFNKNLLPEIEPLKKVTDGNCNKDLVVCEEPHLKFSETTDEIQSQDIDDEEVEEYYNACNGEEDSNSNESMETVVESNYHLI